MVKRIRSGESFSVAGDCLQRQDVPGIKHLIVWSGNVEWCYLMSRKAKGFRFVDIMPETRMDLVSIKGAIGWVNQIDGGQ